MKSISTLLFALLLGHFSNAQATSLYVRNVSNCAIDIIIFMVPASCNTTGVISSNIITIPAGPYSITYTNATGSLPPGISPTGYYFLAAQVNNSIDSQCNDNAVKVGESCAFIQTATRTMKVLSGGTCTVCGDVNIQWDDENAGGPGVAVLSLFP